MMLPVVKLEQLKVFSCDECSFVSDDKLATQQHQTSSHHKELREAKPQLGQISDTVRKKDSSLLACQTHFERRSIKKENMLECVLCDQTFPSKDPLKEHLLQVHVQGIQPVAVPNSIQCCICALRFDSNLETVTLRSGSTTGSSSMLVTILELKVRMSSVHFEGSRSLLINRTR